MYWAQWLNEEAVIVPEFSERYVAHIHLIKSADVMIQTTCLKTKIIKEILLGEEDKHWNYTILAATAKGMMS